VKRFVDRGAITAAYVGIGMAVTIAISFLLIIPIGDVALIPFALFSGLLIGYYANQRSDRRAGPWHRILVNGIFAALVTGLTAAVLLLGVKALFFYADNGYRDASAGGPITCSSGPDCVYQRHRLIENGGRVAAMEEAGITDAASFSDFYWSQQFGTAGLIVALTMVGGLGGAAMYGVFRPKAPREPVTSGQAPRTA
jgi:hypothetical protein